MSSAPCYRCHKTILPANVVYRSNGRPYRICLRCRATRRARAAQSNQRTSRRSIVPVTTVRSKRCSRPEGLRPDAYRKDAAPVDLGLQSSICASCGALHWLAERVSGSVSCPVYESCCKKGAVRLASFKRPPPYIERLYSSCDSQCKDFRHNIRQYNSTFAFVSTRCNIDQRIRDGVNTFQIHGALHHLQGPLEVPAGQEPAYAQLFFYDPQVTTALRRAWNPRLDSDLLLSILTILQQVNPHVALYQTAHKRLRSFQGPARAFITPQLRLVMQEGTNSRRHNLPTTDEVAVIIPQVAEELSAPSRRDILLTLRNPNPNGPESNFLTRIDQNHVLYMPLAYPLLFPFGDNGYGWNSRLQRDVCSANDADSGENREAYGPVDNNREANGPVDHSREGYGPVDHDQAFINRRERVSQRAWYQYHLHGRLDAFSTLFRAGRLFQQFVCDACAASDQNKLDWIARNQKNIRADLYNGLEDALRREDVDLATVGRRLVLPWTHSGSDRAMHRCYQNAMAIVRHFGRPTLFITFTANPKWPEINRELLPGQDATDRPDIVARVFHLKVQLLLDDLKRGEVFGPYLGSVYTIEYQKRGLPHMHLLLFTDPAYRFDTEESINGVISAEMPLPGASDDPEGLLGQNVRAYMLHGPCGDACPTAPCMKEDKHGVLRCSKHYPRALQERTVVSENGYPVYRRRDTHATHESRSFRYDNSWVVPHNPHLLRRYNAHINVEVCASVQAVKYIFKYVYKGGDRTALHVESPDGRDEIKTYLNARYIGPVQAVWFLFEFAMHEELPSVMALAVHLPGFQPIRFNADAADPRAEVQLALANGPDSTLMAYFDYNARNPAEPKVLYQDFPKTHTWLAPRKAWKVREKGWTIGRMFFIPPIAGEKFFLRLLLTAVPGATSFADLRTIEGEVYPTFRAACSRLGLLHDDNEWIETFREASTFASGRQLRRLFVTALLNAELNAPSETWMAFRAHFCDDLRDRCDQFVTVVPAIDMPHYDLGLFLIGELLQDADKSLSDFDLPLCRHQWRLLSNNRLIDAELDYDVPEQTAQSDARVAGLNSDQRLCFDTITTAICEHPETAHFFVQGPAGTGKTTLYKALCSYYRARERIVICVASSGIASLLLPGGRTSHSRFKIPIDVTADSTCSFTGQSDTAGLLRQAALVVWDKVPMQHRFCLEAVDRTLRDIRSAPDQLFGGLPVVLGGDFAQILPVVPKAGRAETVAACLQRSPLWTSLKQLRLTRNMRLHTDATNLAYANWLARVPYDAELQNCAELPESVCDHRNAVEFLASVYPPSDLASMTSAQAFFRGRAVLTVLNEVAAEINHTVLAQLPSEMHVKFSSDQADTTEISGDPADNLPVKFLQSLSPGSLPLAQTRLKVGAPIMIMRNIDPAQGVCNGSRLLLTAVHRHLLEGRMLGGDFDGQVRLVPRVSMSTSKSELYFKLTRRQFPVRLAFAMTVNKSQGQSLDTVGIDLRREVFAHGQLYVALSRTTDVTRLSVLLPEQNNSGRDEQVLERTRRVKNVVFDEILLRS